MVDNGAYERVTRNMVDNLSVEFKDFKKEIRQEFALLKMTNQELYNHLSSRLPPWAVAVGGFGSMIIGAIISIGIKSISGQ